MSYLTYAVIDGLLNRKRPVKIKFNRHCNVIFGVNGAGKTTMLQILDGAMSGKQIPREHAFFKRAEVGIYSENLGREIVRVCDFSDLTNKVPAGATPVKVSESEVVYIDNQGNIVSGSNRFSWRSLDSEDNPKINWSHTYLPITRLFGPVRSNPARPTRNIAGELDEQLIYELFEEGLNRTWLEFYNGVLSNIQKTQQEGLTNVFQEVFTSKSSKKQNDTSREPDVVLYSMVKRFLGRQNSHIRLGDEEAFLSKMTDPLLRRVSSRIYDVETKIESLSQPIDLLKVEIEKMFHGNKTVTFDAGRILVTAKDGTPIRLSKLSSGEKNILKILIELFKVERSSLLIDEPELSMHIDWQRDLLTLFRRLNPRAQLVMATHSPEIVSNAKDDEIIEI